MAAAMALVLLAITPGSVASASAVPALPTCSKTISSNCVSPSAGDSTITLGGSTSSDPDAAGPGSSDGARPVAVAPAEYTERTHVPACTGNLPEGNDVLCTAAVSNCPLPGDVEFWVFTRRVNRPTNTPVTTWRMVTDPTTVCIGPDDPAVDPAVALPALVEREFRRVVVLKGVAEVSPEPETLVNIPTLFTTSAPESYDIPVTLLGQSVVITAKAQRWTWNFGDGATASTIASGTRGRVEHAYRATGSRGAYVVVEWSGTFSVNGGPPRPILGTATTTGEPTQVEVRQARSELVDSSS